MNRWIQSLLSNLERGRKSLVDSIPPRNTGYTVVLLFSIIALTNISAQENFQIMVERLESEHHSWEDAVGMVTITYEPGEEGTFLSLGAEDPQSGQFGIIVDNLYLPSSDEEDSPHSVSTTFNLSKLRPNGMGKALSPATPGAVPENLIIYIHIANALLTYPYPPSTWIGTAELNVAVSTIYIVSRIYALGFIQNLVPAPEPPVINENDELGRYSYHRRVPNIDLNDSEHDDTDSYAGDLNACAPASTSNSLMWMANEYDDITLPDDMTHRKLLEEISEDVQREREAGPNNDDWIKGVLDFAETHNLPIEVKYQSFYFNDNINSSSGNSTARNFDTEEQKPPTWDFLVQMMQEGEDVTIGYTWKDGDKWAAHAVCMTGILELNPGGTKRISFKHDLYQGIEGGLRQENHTITVDENGWMRFGPNGENYIYQINAKSPVPPERGWFNEIFDWLGLGKAKQADGDFIELAFNESISDPENYRITFYNGSDGTVYDTRTLEEFTMGESSEGVTTYSFTMSDVPLVPESGGFSISYTGSVIPGQFLSYGGAFTATEGDATGMLSHDIGTLTPGEALELTGSGNMYDHFVWSNSTSPSPGTANMSQVFGENSSVDEYDRVAPESFELGQNYPNPFNPSTTIQISVPASVGSENTSLTIYDILGNEVKTLINGKMSAGVHTIQWDGSNNSGQEIPSGVYHYRLRSGPQIINRKMLLLR